MSLPPPTKRFTMGTFANFCHVVVDGKRAFSAGRRTARLAPRIRGRFWMDCEAGSMAVDVPDVGCGDVTAGPARGEGMKGSWRPAVAVAEEAVMEDEAPGVWPCRVADERCEGEAVALATAAGVARIASSFVGPLPL